MVLVGENRQVVRDLFDEEVELARHVLSLVDDETVESGKFRGSLDDLVPVVIPVFFWVGDKWDAPIENGFQPHGVGHYNGPDTQAPGPFAHEVVQEPIEGQQYDLSSGFVILLGPVEGHHCLSGAGRTAAQVVAIQRQLVDLLLFAGEVLVGRQFSQVCYLSS